MNGEGALGGGCLHWCEGYPVKFDTTIVLFQEFMLWQLISRRTSSTSTLTSSSKLSGFMVCKLVTSSAQ